MPTHCSGIMKNSSTAIIPNKCGLSPLSLRHFEALGQHLLPRSCMQFCPRIIHQNPASFWIRMSGVGKTEAAPAFFGSRPSAKCIRSSHEKCASFLARRRRQPLSERGRNDERATLSNSDVNVPATCYDLRSLNVKLNVSVASPSSAPSALPTINFIITYWLLLCLQRSQPQAYKPLFIYPIC